MPLVPTAHPGQRLCGKVYRLGKPAGAAFGKLIELQRLLADYSQESA
jgi:hypothetical protein